MISKIRQIRGIGRFKNFVPDPPIELGDVTIIFGENGKGKSSLAAIFRSIASGNLDDLDRRTTIGANRKSIVIGLDDGNKIAYSSPGQTWSRILDNLLVFDETFIHENVSIGPLVDIDQRRNLNSVILGNKARQLSLQEEEVKATIKSINDEIRATQKAIESRIKRPDSDSITPMSFNAFMELQPDSDLDSRLRQHKLRLDQLRRASNVLSQPEFVKVEVPTFPFEDIERLLQSSIEDVAASAETRIQAHLGKFSDEGLEDWIERGTVYISDSSDDCPYCGQPLQASSLIQHYQAYFSEAYKALKTDVEEFPSRRLQFGSEMDSVNKAIAENIGTSDRWRSEEIEGLINPLQDFEEIRRTLDELLRCTETLLAEKSRRPLEKVELSADFNSAHETWNQVSKLVSASNRLQEENNLKIRDHKNGLAVGNLDETESKMLKLENTGIRNSDEVSALCEKFSQLQKEQQSENQRKDDIQTKIKQEVKNTYLTYGKRVNELLKKLNADFTLNNLKQRLDGTKRQAEYHIGLLGVDIPVGGDRTAKSGQSYKTTLSEGDRRTLALALFLATLERSVSLEDATLVFDDPVTSMDDNRSSGTADLILGICEKVRQVIVLSHRKRFLHNFWIKYERGLNRYGDIRLHEVCSYEDENGLAFSEIRPKWNIKRATETDFEENVRYLVKYIRNSPETDMRNAAPKLRFVLETHYQWLYQDEFANGSKQFGEFIGMVLACVESSRLYPLKKQDGQELRRLNEATSTFHHPGSLDLEETELRELCKDTLNLIGRRY